MTVVQEIKSRADVVEIISDYVSLQKAGRNFKANCPFHTENTPSFIVFPERQTWRCFGACVTGGDVISFVMKAENQDFSQALSHLAQRTGVTLPSRQRRENEEVILSANEKALEFFREVLRSSEGYMAREYIRVRGVDGDAEEMFSLGLSPGGRDVLTRHLIAQGYREEVVIAAGLATRNHRGEIMDLFHRRLIFPILDAAGQVVGFGGRDLNNSEPKYINTPRTTVFDKGSILYGLSAAKEHITHNGEVVIVEGYMDVIAAHQYGFQNVVASMGTALTEQQVSRLRVLSSSFVLALDPDHAGREATLRSLESSWSALQIDFLRSGGRSGIVFNQRHLSASLKIAALPIAKDPDTLIREDPKEWSRLVSEAQPLLDYLFTVLPGRFNANVDDGRLQLVNSLGPFIRSEGNPFTQRRYIQNLANLVASTEAHVEKQIWSAAKLSTSNRRVKRANARAYVAPQETGTDHRDTLEEYCLSLLLTYPDLREAGVGIPQDYFELSENRDIFTKWATCATIEGIRGGLPIDLTEHFETLLNMDNPPLGLVVRERALEEVVGRLKERFFKVQGQALMEQLDGVDWRDKSNLESSLNHAQEINQQLRELFSG